MNTEPEKWTVWRKDFRTGRKSCSGTYPSRRAAYHAAVAADREDEDARHWMARVNTRPIWQPILRLLLLLAAAWLLLAIFALALAR